MDPIKQEREMIGMDVTLQEQQMIQILREWSGKDDYSLQIEYRDGAWDITLSSVLNKKNKTARGTGASFDVAWDQIEPTWAR